MAAIQFHKPSETMPKSSPVCVVCQSSSVMIGLWPWVAHLNYFTSSDPHHVISRCILADILTFYLAFYLTYILAFYLTSILAVYLTWILTWYLAYILTHSIWHYIWHSFWHSFIWHSIWHSSWHSVQRCPGPWSGLAVEFEQCPLRSGAGEEARSGGGEGEEEEGAESYLKI